MSPATRDCIARSASRGKTTTETGYSRGSTMSAPIRVLVLTLGLALGTGFLPSPAHATDAESVRLFDSELGKRATALLERAVRHIEQNGEKGAADFSRQANFVDRDLYAYAVRIDGRFLASGGSSAALIGDNVLDYTDIEGKAFFREMIELARAKGGGQVEYRWFNPADSRGDPKLTLFRKVGEVIVAVGFYPPRATPVQARAMLRDAAKAMKADATRALAQFRRLDGPFIHDDLYVFVIDMADGRFLAHGATPALVGSNGYELLDPNGKPIVSEMLKVAAKKGDGELDYSWRNPTTGKVEKKHSYFRAVDGKLVGVGYFQR
ncbi:cache domain-containing protein [Aromatoleum anaerobium]|nr:cache domain-containing protein [Aromatoleum anaerobium]